MTIENTLNERAATGTEARVCQDIAERQRKGVRKYGTTVEGNPLGLLQWLQHAYEESLDLPIYLKRTIEQLQGIQPAQPQKDLVNLPVVELPASMRCGDAINVPPLTQEKPWYPDDGDWVEVSDACCCRPHELDPYDKVVTLTRYARMSAGAWHPPFVPDSAGNFLWDEVPSSLGRIVAYKVV